MAPKLPLDLSRTLLLVGAGISIDPPSNIPAAAGLTGVLVDWICSPAPNARGKLERALAPPDSRQPYEGPYATTRFELLLEWIRYFEPAIYDALATLDDCGTPNLWHLHIAAAIRRGAIVLTTNFDTRIEAACRMLGFDARVAVVSSARLRPGELADANLLKLHGSFPLPGRSCTPVGTLSQISRFGLGFESLRALAGPIQSMAAKRTLVVCGYSGWDSYDVVPLLEAVKRRAPLLWHAWRPSGMCHMAPPRQFDTLAEVQPGDTPAALFLADTARRTPGRVWELAGPTDGFFSRLWQGDAAAEARRALEAAPPQAGTSPDSIAVLRKVLFSDEFMLAPDSAAALVDQLVFPYNSDDYKEPRPDSRTSGEVYAEEADGESDSWTDRVVALLKGGRHLEAADAFAERIAGLEAQAEEVDPLTYGDALVLGLQSAFWGALHALRTRDALRIALRIKREGRRRGLLWAIVFGEYLEANVWLEWATPAPPARRLRHPPEFYRAGAAARLDRVMTFALRIPRLDFFVDALRLRRYMEHDPVERQRLENALLLWAARLPPCEERLLAFFDHVRWVAGREHDAALADAARRLETEATSAWTPVAAPFAAAARCYAALAANDDAAVRAGLNELRSAALHVPTASNRSWDTEIDKFERILDAWGRTVPPSNQ